MFARRRTLTRWQKVRRLLWPDMGLSRTFSYYAHRMRRLPGSPAYIAAGFAIGAAVSFTPFLGLHILLGMVLCFLLRASVVAMVLATLLVGNPWFLPLIWISSYKIGHAALGSLPQQGGLDTQALSWASFRQDPGLFLADYIWPMTVGCLPLLLPAAAVSFFVCRRLIAGYRASRLEHLAQRAGSSGEAR